MQEPENPGPREPTLEDFQRARALPPPAFPPGFRRVSVRRRLERQGRREVQAGGQQLQRVPFPAEAFISPDEPIDRSVASDAYISPDDPLPHRRPLDDDLDDEFDPDEVVVTGIGDDPHLGPEEFRPTDDADLVALTEQVVALADALRLQGEAGLREHVGMSRFEVTLRAYCAGYLAGRRTDEGRA